MPNKRVVSTSVFFSAEFKRGLRALSKKYRHIRSDLQPLLDKLGEGEMPGVRIQTHKKRLFKVRINNSDIQKGKSSGYRLIYWQVDPSRVALITIYSKLDQGDVSVAQIRRIMSEYQ